MKFILNGIPRGAQVSAFMPHFTRAAGSGAVRYKAAVRGQPGTQAIPAPTTNIPRGGVVGQALMGTARSSDAPDFIWPNLYFEANLDGSGTMGPVTPVRIYSDNLMPVPAADPRGIPARLAQPIAQRYNRQIRQPPVLVMWPSANQS